MTLVDVLPMADQLDRDDQLALAERLLAAARPLSDDEVRLIQARYQDLIDNPDDCVSLEDFRKHMERW